ncbi:MAG: adenosylmethionine decarboxylase [Candidatus Obscuribacterales bacterium]|nr:adenosylmethionine decarboxylase [Candidatus Obscuribacterales bacterium]
MSLRPFPTSDSGEASSTHERQDSPCESEFAFSGKHFMGSYMGCQYELLTSPEFVLAAMREAIEASGASLLNEAVHLFPNGGMTAVFLLSESHASIHTYPEHNSCFVDLFTCGETCCPEEFDAVLRRHLNPGRANVKVLLRHELVEDSCRAGVIGEE